MSGQEEPSRTERLISSCVLVVVSIVALVLLVALYDFFVGLPHAAGEHLGKAFGPVAFGFALAGWRLPRETLRIVSSPYSRFAARPARGKSLSTRFQTPIQRALFVVGCAGLAPWFFFTAVRQLWRSEGLLDYLRNVLLFPVKYWFDGQWEWRYEWYDYSFLPSAIAIVLATVWPWTAAPILRWIKGAQGSA